MALANGLTPKQDEFARAYVETGCATVASLNSDIDLDLHATKPGAYVYLLLCPDMKRIIYVGKGRGSRMRHHVRDVKAGKVSGTKKHLAIRAYLESGKEPVPVVFAQGLTDRAAYQIEKSLIIRIGTDNLANTAAGRGCGLEKLLVVIDEFVARIMPYEQWVSRRQPKPEHLQYHQVVLDNFAETRSHICARIAEQERGATQQV